MTNKKTKKLNWRKILTVKNVFPYILIVFGLVGLLASSILVIEKITLLREPSADLSCNLNPVYSCSNVINSEQSEILGFPNELIGMAMFAALITLGVIISTKVKLPDWIWKCFVAGMIGAMGFVLWFFYQSAYVINSLCIFCTTVWFSIWTITSFGYAWLYDEKFFKLKKNSILQKSSDVARKNIGLIWFLFIVLIATLILKHFWYYYGPKFGF